MTQPSHRTPATDPLAAARAPIAEGRFTEAALIVDRHLRQHPTDARGWGLMGLCLRNLRRLDDAGTALNQSLQVSPDFPPAIFELALLRRDQGHSSEAIELLQRSLTLAPGNRAARWELARLLGSIAPQRGLETLTPLLNEAMVPFECKVLAAQLRLRLGNAEQALSEFRALHAERPSNIEVLDGAYWSMVQQGLHDEETVRVARALTSLAPSASRWLNLSQELQILGDFAGCRAAIEAALAWDPDYLPAQWAQFQQPKSAVPASIEEAEQFCRDWDQGLTYFESLDFSDPKYRSQIWPCIGQCTAFYRHYLGDEVDLQHRYGRLVTRMMAALVPDQPCRHELRNGRRRIGFCSAHFREHTVARLFVPLIEALDRSAFELYVFSLHDRGDGWSDRLRQISCFESQVTDAPSWRQRIVDADLDILIFPEVGMHPMVQGLAATRLAPVQMCLWGHPISTGFETMDAFLTADQLEGQDNAARYWEQLIRLPGLGHALQVTDLPVPREPTFEVEPERYIELLCAQTVYKLLPQQDALFAQILARVPNARLHLLADHRAPVRQWLRERMEPAFAAAGVDSTERLLIHGLVDHAEYLGLANCFRLNLDSIGWSGGMSALDLLAQGLPTICLPGESMRSQQTAQLLRWLGLEELIARDAVHYVELAVELAGDPSRCEKLSERLMEQRHRLFADPTTSNYFNRLLAAIDRDGSGKLKFPRFKANSPTSK